MKIYEIENGYRKNFNVDDTDPFDIELTINLRALTDEGRAMLPKGEVPKDAKYEIFVGGPEIDGEHKIIHDTSEIAAIIDTVIEQNFGR